MLDIIEKYLRLNILYPKIGIPLLLPKHQQGGAGLIQASENLSWVVASVVALTDFRAPESSGPSMVGCCNVVLCVRPGVFLCSCFTLHFTSLYIHSTFCLTSRRKLLFLVLITRLLLRRRKLDRSALSWSVKIYSIHILF